MTEHDNAPRRSADLARISLLVDPDLRRRLDELAAAERRTLTAQCIVLLERALSDAANALAA